MEMGPWLWINDMKQWNKMKKNISSHIASANKQKRSSLSRDWFTFERTEVKHIDQALSWAFSEPQEDLTIDSFHPGRVD